MGNYTENNVDCFESYKVELSLYESVYACGTRKRVRRQLIIDVSIDHRGKNVELAPIYFSKKIFEKGDYV